MWDVASTARNLAGAFVTIATLAVVFELSVSAIQIALRLRKSSKERSLKHHDGTVKAS